MAKRFTDKNKWNDEWYLSLNNDYRIVWEYLLDTCNHAGILKKNFKMLNFCCNVEFNEEQIKQIFKDRIVDLGNYYFIPKYLKFQYPTGLNSNKPAIVSVRNELKEHNLTAIIIESFGNDYLMIKDKDKDKDKDKVKDIFKEVENKKQNIEIDKILNKWKQLPLQKSFLEISLPEEHQILLEISRLGLNIDEPINFEMILEAIDNYKIALNLEDSQAHQHKIVPWLKKDHVKKYISYNFNIENYKRNNFDKTKVKENNNGKHERNFNEQESKYGTTINVD